MKVKIAAVNLYLIVISLVTIASSTICLADAKSQIKDAVAATNDGNDTDISVTIPKIINAMLFIAGVIAVVMIIIGGMRYITSNGDASKVKAAKDTILYSVIGLVVAILAFAIVTFVVGAL